MKCWTRTVINWSRIWRIGGRGHEGVRQKSSETTHVQLRIVTKLMDRRVPCCSTWNSNTVTHRIQLKQPTPSLIDRYNKSCYRFQLIVQSGCKLFKYFLFWDFRIDDDCGTLLPEEIDDGLRLGNVHCEPLLDRFHVIIHSSTPSTSLQEPVQHRFLLCVMSRFTSEQSKNNSDWKLTLAPICSFHESKFSWFRGNPSTKKIFS